MEEMGSENEDFQIIEGQNKGCFYCLEDVFLCCTDVKRLRSTFSDI